MSHRRSTEPGRPSGQLAAVITEYAQKVIRPTMSLVMRQFPSHLRQMADVYGWNTTTDIPPTAFALIRQRWGPHMARLKQRALVGLVAWARDRYAITEELLTVPFTPVAEIKDRIWSDATQAGILAAVPPAIFPGVAKTDNGHSPTRSERLRARNNYERQRVIYPVVYVCLRWALRGRELSSLRVSDWNASSRTLTIQRSATKRHNPRVLLVDAATATVIAGAAGNRSGHEVLFRTRRGKPWGVIYLNRQVKKFLRTLGMSGSLQECHRSSIRRLLDENPEQEGAVLTVTGLSKIDYLRMYSAPKRAQNQARAQSQEFRDTLMATMFAAFQARSQIPGSADASPETTFTDFHQLLTQGVSTLSPQRGGDE